MRLINYKKIMAFLLGVSLLMSMAIPVHADMLFEEGLPAQVDSAEHLVENLEPLSDLPAFPGADGYAKYITGGRNGKVIHVTNLNDSGEGSFAEAINNGGKTDEPRIIVFDVSGTISLANKSVYGKSIKNVTIAGQTAPGEGITFTGGNFYLKNAENVIIRYIHFRHGQATSKDDSFFVQASKNIMVDHCSFSYGSDEVCSARNTNNLTIQWSLMTNGVRTHSMGGLQEWNSETIHHCLLGNQNDRNPKVKGVMDFTNNVLYNWGEFSYVAGGNSAGNAWGNVVNNYFIAGLDTKYPDYAVVRSNGKYFLHLAGNLIDSNMNGILDGVNTGIDMIAPVQSAADYLDRATFGRETPLVLVKNRMDMPILDHIDTAEEAYYKILNFGGASVYHNADGTTELFHDDIDTEILTSVKEQTGKILLNNAESKNADGESFTQEFINNRPKIDVNDKDSEWYRPDADQDGMPDAWETKNGLNPNDAEDRNNIAPSGYTWIEEYLNELAAPGFPTEDYSCEEEAEAEETKERTYILRLTDYDGTTKEYEAIHGENHLMVPFAPIAEYLGYKMIEINDEAVIVEYPFQAASGLLNIDTKTGEITVKEGSRGYFFSTYTNLNEMVIKHNNAIYVPITLVSTGMGAVYEQTVEDDNVGVITIHDAEVYKSWHNDNGIRDKREVSGPSIVAQATENGIKLMFDKETALSGAAEAKVSITVKGTVYTASVKDAEIWGSNKVALFENSDFVNAGGKTLSTSADSANLVVDAGAFADYYNSALVNEKAELTVEAAVVRTAGISTGDDTGSTDLSGADSDTTQEGEQLTVLDAMEAMHKLFAMKDINGVYNDEINTEIVYSESAEAQIVGMDNKKGWNIIKAYISKAASSASDTEKAWVEIDLNDDVIIPGKVIDTISGKNVELIFNISDKLVCNIDGLNLQAESASDINLSINTDIDSITNTVFANAIKEAAKEKQYVLLDYEAADAFNALINLNIDMDINNSGLWANLYSWDNATNTSKLIKSVQIDEAGNVQFEFTNAADYFVTVSDEALYTEDDANQDKDDVNDNDNTGTSDVRDNTDDGNNMPTILIISGIALACVIVALVIVVMKKRKK